MPHKNDCCLQKDCGHPFSDHGAGRKGGYSCSKCGAAKCPKFEFIAPSARNNKDILFSTQFKSDSSERLYSVISWRQGDYSCSCKGFSTQRHCKHIDQVKANPAHYKEKRGINAGAGSIIGTVAALSAKMNEMEAAVKRGDAIELSRLQAEIEMQQQMFEAAGQGLGERFAQVKANVHQHVFGNVVVAQAPAKPKVNPDNIFGTDEDPFSVE